MPSYSSHQDPVSKIATEIMRGLLLNSYVLSPTETAAMQGFLGRILFRQEERDEIIPESYEDDDGYESAQIPSTPRYAVAKGLPTAPTPEQIYRDLLLGCAVTHLLSNPGLEGNGRYVAVKKYLDNVLTQNQALNHGNQGQSLVIEIAFLAMDFRYMGRTLNDPEVKDRPFMLIDMYRALFKLVDLPENIGQKLNTLQELVNPDTSWDSLMDSEKEYMLVMKKRAEAVINAAAAAEPSLQRSLLLPTSASSSEAQAVAPLKEKLRLIINGYEENGYQLSHAARLRRELEDGRDVVNFEEVKVVLGDSYSRIDIRATLCNRLVGLLPERCASEKKYMDTLAEKAKQFVAHPNQNPHLSDDENVWLDKVCRWGLQLSDQMLKNGQAEYAFKGLMTGQTLGPIPEGFQKALNDTWSAFPKQHPSVQAPPLPTAKR